MTEDEKRQQKAMLLLQYEETRQELEHLRAKAWDTSEKIKEVAYWLEEAREVTSASDHRQKERDAKITTNSQHYKVNFDFEAVSQLREELRATNARVRDLAAQKKALGLGS
jgi:hypothetical protein